jgi:hypothetical protein
MSQNKYVLLCTDGTSHDCSRKEQNSGEHFDLAKLLEQGWRPVHETPLGFQDQGYVLILLVKD